MIIKYDRASKSFFYDPLAVGMVGEWAELERRKGPLAIQYLLFWVYPWGPYCTERVRRDEQRDELVAAAVNQMPVQSGALAPGLYKDPLFKRALEKAVVLRLGEEPRYKERQTLVRKRDEALDRIDDVSFLAPVKKKRRRGKSGEEDEEDDGAGEATGPDYIKKMMEVVRLFNARIEEIEREVAAEFGAGDYSDMESLIEEARNDYP